MSGQTFFSVRLHRRVSPVAFHDKWPSLTTLLTAWALRRHLPAIAGTAKIGPVSAWSGVRTPETVPITVGRFLAVVATLQLTVGIDAAS